MAAAPPPPAGDAGELDGGVKTVGTERKLERPSSAASGSETGDDDEREATQPVEAARRRARWYSRLNPLRLRKIPPVPTEREVSREYGAGFFSIVTFEWMSPLMKVRLIGPRLFGRQI